MNFAQALVIFLLIIAAMTNIGLAFFSWQRRPAVWIRPFVLLMLAVAQWNLTEALEIGTSQLESKLFWHNAQYIGITLVPVLFLAFVLAYHSQRRWLTRQYLPLLIIPAATLFLAWTNINNLFRQQGDLWTSEIVASLEVVPGPWFWVHIAYFYLLLLIATLLLGQIWLRTPHHRESTIIILLAAVIPWMGIVLAVAGLAPVDLTPIAFTVMGLLLGWGLLRLQLFDLAPMARGVVVDKMRDGMIVLDKQRHIADINRAVQKMLGRSSPEIIGHHITAFFPQLTWLADFSSKEMVQIEIQWDTDTYELQISTIYASDTLIGYLLILHAITERKRIEAELLSQKHLLQNLVIIARATTTTQTLNATLQNILDVAVAINKAEFGSLFLVNNRGEITHSILTQEKALSSQEQKAINQQVLEKGLFGWVLLHGELALIHNAAEDERWLSLPERNQKVGSALGVPIIDHHNVVGVLTLTHSEPGHFSEEQATLMQGAADHMALALRNAQLYDAQKRLAEREHTLYQVMRTMDERLDEQWITRTAVDSINHFTGWSALAILLAKEGKLEVEAVSGQLAEMENNVLNLADGLNSRAFITGKTQTLSDCDEGCSDLPPGFRSGVAIPLRQGETNIGVFGLYSKKTAAFNSDDVQLGEALAEAMALALENAWLHANIRNYATDLSTLIASSRDGIIYIGLDKKVRVINEMAFTLLGLNQGSEQWVNHSISHIFTVVYTLLPPSPILAEFNPERELVALEAEIDSIQTGNEPASEGELTLPPHTIHWLSLPLVSDEEALGRLLVLRDVTEERLLARMRDDLIHMTVHDLRNPLSSQRMAIELLGPDIPEESRPFLEVMENNNTKMLTLVDNLLDISRLETRQMPLNYEYVLVPELIEAALAQQRALATDKEITLSGHVTDGVPTAWVDKALIERVFQNLLGNAVKFTPRQGLIRVTADTDPDSYGE
jgi:PAS domain S-box-containing protein